MSEPIQYEDIFTPQALCRWKKILEGIRKKILDNVFCGRCVGSVTILIERAEMIDKALVLRGKCKQCGKNICRVIESEDE
jgi:hypothetical protein